MATLTFNQIKKLFENIKAAHWQLKSFGFGTEQEINGATEADRKYPKWWVIPVDSITREQTIERTFEFLVFDLVQKDETNEEEVASDTEQIIHDLIKTLKSASDNYNIIGEPQAFYFTERYADDVTGWRILITIETNFASGDCDMPMDDFVSTGTDNTVLILNQDGDTIATLYGGQTYTVTELTTLLQTLDDPPPTTIIQDLT